MENRHAHADSNLFFYNRRIFPGGKMPDHFSSAYFSQRKKRRTIFFISVFFPVEKCRIIF